MRLVARSCLTTNSPSLGRTRVSTWRRRGLRRRAGEHFPGRTDVAVAKDYRTADGRGHPNASGRTTSRDTPAGEAPSNSEEDRRCSGRAREVDGNAVVVNLDPGHIGPFRSRAQGDHQGNVAVYGARRSACWPAFILVASRDDLALLIACSGLGPAVCEYPADGVRGHRRPRCARGLVRDARRVLSLGLLVKEQ
jgi:hypothetical protein